MKKQLLFIPLIFGIISHLFAQQWSGPDNTSGKITRTGDIEGASFTSKRSSSPNFNFLRNQTSISNGSVIGQLNFKSPSHLGGLIVARSVGSWGSNANQAGTRLEFWTQDNTTSANLDTRMLIDHNGYVGIGTSNPSSKLEIAGYRGDSELIINSIDANPDLRLKAEGDDKVGLMYDRNKDAFLIHVNDNGINFSENSFAINKNGNIGIGTTEANSNLHVSGGNGDAELLIEADKDNSNEMDNAFITLSQDMGFVKGFIGLVGNNNTAAHINKYPRKVQNASGDWVDQTDYLGTKSNYMLLGMNNGEGVQLGAQGEVRMTVHHNGNVGIGTTEPNEKLEVNGNIRTKEILVEASPWPDYVFESEYELKSLEEVSAFIEKNGHLPNVPSASEVEEEGIAVGEMNSKLLEKIEELTLYVIQLQDQVNRLKKEMKDSRQGN